MENCELKFTDRSARRDRPDAPWSKDTGARGLRSIIEEVMLDIMFELPDQPEGSCLCRHRRRRRGTRQALQAPEPKTKSA